MVHLRDGVGLHEVLRRVADVVNHAEIGLQNRVLVLERGVELELVAQRGLARRHVVAGRNVDLIKHVVVEVVFVRPDAGLLMRINAEGGDERLDAVFDLHKRVNVRGVCRRIADDERCVHVTGRHRWEGELCGEHHGGAAVG
jgi:hypothetical protein